MGTKLDHAAAKCTSLESKKSAMVIQHVEFNLLRSHIDENLVLTLSLKCFFNS
jgi:hypothetical protein